MRDLFATTKGVGECWPHCTKETKALQYRVNEGGEFMKRNTEPVRTDYETKYTPDYYRSWWLDDVDRLMEGVFGRPFNRYFGGGTYPSIDLYEEKDYLVVRAEIPGVKREDITLNVSGNVLVLSGEKKWDETVEKEGYYYKRESTYGSFSRSIPLPKWVNAEKIEATYHEGILEVHIYKAEESDLKKIEIH